MKTAAGGAVSGQSNAGVKIAACAVNATALAWEDNLEAAKAAIEIARGMGASFAALPELCLSGIGCEDAFFGGHLTRFALTSLERLLPHTRGMAVTVGLPLEVQGTLFSAAALLCDGRILGFAPRREFPKSRLSYARRWFSPWRPGDVNAPKSLVWNGEVFPLAHMFEALGKRVALSVGGEVLNHPEWAGGADICLDAHARAFSFGEQAAFEKELAQASLRAGCAVASANFCGNESGTVIYGGGAAVAVQGAVTARSPRFSFASASAAVGEFSGRMPAARTLTDPLATKEEEFTRAVSLGMFDYLRKTWSRGFALSLSGGADSAAVACLVHLLARFGIRELGSAGFAEALHWKDLTDSSSLYRPGDSEEMLEKCLLGLMPRLLITAYQGTKNSSSVTREAALAVARDVGSQHSDFAIDELVAGYRARAEAALGRPLTWEKDDLTLQNIQARVRGPSIWMVANARNALLLTTANRSEAAVGYATMDGDTCGSLAPIAGVDKAWLRKWLIWLETHAPVEGRAFPSLKFINVQAPTAELRPLEAKQTDEGDLMPYALLDEIERLAVHGSQMRPPAEVLSALSERHPEVERTYLKSCVAKFFRMFARSQWKRNRSAPGFHLDDADLSPLSWCRFPVLSGGFGAEIREMEKLSEEN